MATVHSEPPAPRGAAPPPVRTGRKTGRLLRTLAVLILCPLTTQCDDGHSSGPPATSPPATSTGLGGGYNQNLYDIDNGLFLRSAARWVRAYVNLSRNFLEIGDECTVGGGCPVTGVLTANISQEPDADSGITDVLAISAVDNLIETTNVQKDGQRQARIILSLKTDFKYERIGVPDESSPAMAHLLSAVAQLLESHGLGEHIDVLVLGNEPMFETPLDDPHTTAEKYGAFLNRLIDDLHDLRQRSGWSYEIFTGALNKAAQLQHDPTYGPILQAILQTTRARDEVAGIDLHLHVEEIAEAEADLGFVRDTLGATKKIISTEFSLVGLWNNHAADVLETPAGSGCPPNTELFAWLNQLQERATRGTPIHQTDFARCLEAQRWYPQHWFTSFIELFNDPAYDVYAATYGLQSTPTVPAVFYGPTSELWYLNFVYNCTLLGRAADGYCNTNPLVFPDFEAAIEEMNDAGG